MNPPEPFQLPESLKHRLAPEFIDTLNDDLSILVRECLKNLDVTAGRMEGYFSGPEGAYICDALRNADFPVQRFDEWPMMLLWDLEDVEHCEKLASRRYGLDVSDLFDKVEHITHEEALWILAAVERFWEDKMRRGDMAEFFEVELR